MKVPNITLVLLLGLILPLVIPQFLAAEDAGPHPVGYRHLETASGPLDVWYPATAEDSGKVMTRAAYLAKVEAEEDPAASFREYLELLRFEVPEPDQLTEILEQPTKAFEDAPPAPGRWPLVLYHQDAAKSNVTLAEALAARGLVLVSRPPADRLPSLEGPGHGEVDRQRGELESLFEDARELPFADPARLGVVAFSSSSLAGWLWQRDRPEVRALVSLEGWEAFRFGVRILRSHPGFEPRELRAPVLHLTGDMAGRWVQKDFGFLRSLEAADRRALTFPDLGHFSFLDPGVTAGTVSAPEEAAYRLAVEAAADFLATELAGDAAARKRLAGLEQPNVTVEHLPRATELPSEGEVWQAGLEGRLEEVEGALEKSRAAGAEPFFQESTLNLLGYTLLREGRSEEALRAFRLNAAAYPESANTWDSLGEALLGADEKEAARDAYRKALALEPSSRSARTALSELGDEVPERAADDAPRTVVLELPGTADAEVRTGLPFAQGTERELTFDLYRPPGSESLLPVVIFANGIGHPVLKDWPEYTSWARLAAASEMAAVTHETEGDPRPQLEALLEHLRSNASELGIDPDRIALWASSANVRTALPFAMEKDRPLRAAVFYYGVMDFVDLRTDLPLLVARAGLDSPGILGSLDDFLRHATHANLPFELLNYAEGIHGFDTRQPGEESERIVRETLEFLKRHLGL